MTHIIDPMYRNLAESSWNLTSSTSFKMSNYNLFQEPIGHAPPIFVFHTLKPNWKYLLNFTMFEKLAGHSSYACKAGAEKISNVSGGDFICQNFSCAKDAAF
jgi:hypothetical protein